MKYNIYIYIYNIFRNKKIYIYKKGGGEEGYEIR